MTMLVNFDINGTEYSADIHADADGIEVVKKYHVSAEVEEMMLDDDFLWQIYDAAILDNNNLVRLP